MSNELLKKLKSAYKKASSEEKEYIKQWIMWLETWVKGDGPQTQDEGGSTPPPPPPHK